MKKIFNLVATACIIVGISSTAYAKSNYNVSRLYGADRYKTSISISNDFSSGTVQNVIVASGKDFPDALSGSVLSKKYNAPILLLNNTLSESNETLDYINNHLNKSGNIYVLGGTGSISDEFINYMKNQGFNNIIRLGGKDRFDTNKFIVNSMNLQKGTPVVITNGYGFADALSVSSVAAGKGYPILMTGASSLPDETKSILSDIQPNEVYVVGGTGVVSDDIINEVKKLVPSLSTDKIVRISGQTRYDTSLEICKYFNIDTDSAVLASGENFPDALSGSALASKLNAPIILTDGQDLTNQRVFIDSKNYKNLILLGGVGSIDLPIEYSLKGSDQISTAEKDYINNLSNYCNDYITEETSASNTMTELFNSINFNDLGDQAQISNAFEEFAQLFKNGNASLETYKQNLIKLKNNVSNLQSPDGLESLKLDYINNINTEIQSLDTVKGYLDNYVSIFNSMKDAIDSNNLEKLQQELNELQSYNTKYMNDAKQLPNAEVNIMKLSNRLTKIKNSMQ
ncbi:cell wall-binding repeat-containing protein [Clostridium sp. PL3]|uniref:Cell wall-binding repeat-containing protein n=1 Tax=Clostridium thailandense TaxID=2794346 RepID=A0A949TVS1_9CLOT|nr:cell wall-binding repeat-containing protein [Clostridium thailandense]MBV7273353.1 cell wall-binding repeat-containing protein [Clostridium thailandense]